MKVENVIPIAAPPEVVWRITTDVERWPEWMPTMTSVKRCDTGPFVVGSAALIKQPGMKMAEWRVTSLTSGEAFTWETSTWGMRVVASHALTVEGTGTQNLLSVEVSGWLALLLWPFIRGGIGRALELENVCLKTRSELVAGRGDLCMLEQ